jgi:hypothetical protein
MKMQNLCLGEIETVGFAAAVEAADVSVKTANVELVGYELAGGGGLVSVKLRGQVAAVRAAILAAAESAGRVGKVVSTQIIARPSEQIESMIRSADTVGLTPPEPPAAPPMPPQPEPTPPPSEPPAAVLEADPAVPEPEPAAVPEPAPVPEPEPAAVPEPEPQPVEEAAVVPTDAAVSVPVADPDMSPDPDDEAEFDTEPPFVPQPAPVVKKPATRRGRAIKSATAKDSGTTQKRGKK